ncbi:hypothetical protein Y032_0043g850 [Ancylostoma ceylanicum]|nr:hypothetical protein Y032_0043g850 [Ancylostoma ceylanicum]
MTVDVRRKICQGEIVSPKLFTATLEDDMLTLEWDNIYVYLGREVNMMNDLAPELGRRKRAAWGAYESIKDVVKKTRNTRLRAHLFNTTILPALT